MRSSALLQFLGLTLCLAWTIRSLGAQSTTAAAPQALVTFYSNGNFLKSTLPGYKYGKFSGRIMDEYDQLAMLTPGHFVTFNLDPGPHTFSANSWLIARPETGGHLEINLAAGQHYFIGTYLQPLLFVSNYRLEQHTCQEAKKDNINAKPLEQKHLKDYGLPRVLVETSFPACP
jgi:hypothetical protein